MRRYKAYGSILAILVLSFWFKTAEAQQTKASPGSSTVLKKPGLYVLAGDSVRISPFQVEISLSPKAKTRIVGSNETIVIMVFLSGTPKNPSKAKLAADGSFFLARAQREIAYGQIAKFDNIKIPRSRYNQLGDKDIDVEINVYTGRKNSPDNLITGDFFSDKLSNTINRRILLKQKLIYGDD